MTSGARGRLLALLRERSYEKKRVVLASGRESDFFVDCKQTILTAEGHALTGELMFAALDQLGECEAVAGVELGGCPLASAVSLVSFQQGRPLPALYVRKQVKDHGSKRRVEGDKSLRAGLPVVLLEDVITTGGSSLSAVEALREVGANVTGIVALVDRLEGGRDAIEAAGLKLVSLFTKADFGALAPTKKIRPPRGQDRQEKEPLLGVLGTLAVRNSSFSWAGYGRASVTPRHPKAMSGRALFG